MSVVQSCKRGPISFQLSPDSRDSYNAAWKRAAQRLANYLRSLAHQVKIRRHRSPVGAFYSLKFFAPKQRAVISLERGAAPTECDRKMGLIAPVLMGIVLFYWLAVCLTVIAWLKGIIHLLGGHLTRAAIWLSIGCGMMFWWQGTEVIPHPWDFDAWLRGSAVIVRIGALATFVRWRKKQKAMQAEPVWTLPAEATDDTGPIIEVEYKRLPN
jgi:hypothetical protein